MQGVIGVYNIKITTKDHVANAVFRGDISGFYKLLALAFKTGMILIEGTDDSTIIPTTSIDNIIVSSCIYSAGKPDLRLV